MAPHGEPRNRKFTLTFTEQEFAELHEAAAAEGLPTATWLRLVIRRELRSGEGSKQKRKPRK